MEYRRLNAVLPALGKMDPRWLRIGEHRDLRERVIEGFRLKDTIRTIDSECYGPDGESKDSVDQDTIYEIRGMNGLKNKPSTSEVLDWLKLLRAEDPTSVDLKSDGANALPKLHGALLKNEQDVHMFERLAAFMASGRQRPPPSG
jgi:hypothetical protein